MAAYTVKLNALKKRSQQIDELVDAYEDYDFDNMCRVEINGNSFEFDKSEVDIVAISKKLWKIGETEKGNCWRIEMDGEEVNLLC